MKFPAWVLRLPRILADLGRTGGLALGGEQRLQSPDIARASHGFGDARVRLAREPRARVDHLLEVLLLRARLRKGAARLSLLRSLALLAPTRSQAAYIAQRASRFDDEFQAWIARADAARDRQNWADGIEAYSQALLLYEDHAGYLLQRSHCYKEQRDYDRAELGYRDALALGVDVDHAWPHLEHVVLRQRVTARLYPPDVAQLLAAPKDAALRREGMVTSRELRALAWLLLGVEAVEIEWLLAVMRTSPMRADAIRRLLGEPAFFSANRALVGLAGREGGLA